ncbi:MAG TPA: ATP-binding protein [Tepidisphaeraceae bacterium]|nr:ATP-binding protein [Tepidisphaeraceae bacterium]
MSLAAPSNTIELIGQPQVDEAQPQAGVVEPQADNRPEHLRRIEELGRIILAYSEVTEKLQQSHDELNQRVELLQKELSEKNTQLERRNRLAALGEMAAGIAHEIRNPLGAIKLYSGLLKDDCVDRPSSVATLGKVSSAICRMESIVSRVLYFTREVVADRSMVDVVELTREAIEHARTSHSNRNANIELNAPKSLDFELDARLMNQAIINLVSNALDVVDGKRVVVTISRSRSRLRIKVEDEGPGIPVDVIDRVFHPFFTTRDDGTGLGLALVHRIAEAHDGNVEARNREQGGACFEIVI